MDEILLPVLPPRPSLREKALGALGGMLATARQKLQAPPPADIEQRLQTVLKPGEELLWSGRPRGLVDSARLNIITLAATLVVAPVATSFWVNCFTLRPHAAEIAWWGVLAAATAVIYAGVYAVTQYALDRTSYGVTRDAIVIRRWGSRFTTKVDLVSIPNLTLEAGPQDIGNVRFGSDPRESHVKWPSFQKIRHAREVFDIARAAQRKALAEAVAIATKHPE